MAKKAHAYMVTEIMVLRSDVAEDVREVLSELTGQQFSVHGDDVYQSLVYLGNLFQSKKEYYHTLAQGILRGIAHERKGKQCL